MLRRPRHKTCISVWQLEGFRGVKCADLLVVGKIEVLGVLLQTIVVYLDGSEKRAAGLGLVTGSPFASGLFF